MTPSAYIIKTFFNSRKMERVRRFRKNKFNKQYPWPKQNYSWIKQRDIFLFIYDYNCNYYKINFCSPLQKFNSYN